MRGQVQVAEDVAGAFTGLVRQRRPRSIALSGGETARACYERLAGLADLDWAATTVLFGDERFVDVDDPDSNEGMARAALLDHVGPVTVLSARGTAPTVDGAAAAYDEVVAGLGPIDLVHLGLGADGHTASLFPGAPALDETRRMVVATASPDHPHPRITFTFPAIARSRLAVFTVTGEAKRETFARIRAGEDLPAGRVDADEVLWLVDPTVMGT